MQTKLSNIVSKTILVSLAIYFTTLFIHAIKIVNRRQISTNNGIYINNTTDSQYIKKITKTLTKRCKNNICKVQSILDYVTNIPYKVNNFQAHSPQETIQKNFGDCDDKSNLLISMLHELNLESYFVLVPHHIFVIVRL
ncbi:MAG: transglutaminase domain-containing protein, partial [Sulfurovaceae bacterium]|nr:transglutaminase domain-containing protein [Sulfurovaceae bacterium]